MINGVTTEAERAALRSSLQKSKLYLAGLHKPNVVFKAQINQTFSSLDRVLELIFDNVSYGAYTDVLVDQTVWIGLSEGGYEVGVGRIRKAATSDRLYIALTSQLALEDNQHITVMADYLPLPRPMFVDSDGDVLADGETPFSDQYTNFDPVVIMGSDWVLRLTLQPEAEVEATSAKIDYSGTWETVGTDRQSDNTGAYAELEFYGSVIRVSMLKDSFNGIANVYLDGDLVEAVDTYAASGSFETVFEREDLSVDTHTVRIEVSGTKNPLAAWHWLRLDSLTCQSQAGTIEPQDAAQSWVFGSSITSYSWVAPGSSASSGMNTATPSITYDTEGNYHLYLNVTAANGKSYTGVRKVYAISNPTPVVVRDVIIDYDGGAEFNVEVYEGVDKSALHDQAHVILWSEDWYNGTQGSIGFEPGHEHHIAAGWIEGETIDFDVDGGGVKFTVKGAWYWMDKISMLPTVMNFATRSPNAWDQMPGMTIDRGAWFLLHVLSTITRIMDVRLTDDTRTTKKLESGDTSLWGALGDYAEGTILAAPFVDANGRFWLKIDSQMVPVEDRGDWPVAMELDAQDIENGFDLKKQLVGDTSQIDISGKTCDTSGRERTYYAFAPGHQPNTHGNPITSDKLVVSGQAQINQMAGLLNGWRNNPYPDVLIKLPSNFRVVSMGPHQFLRLAMGADQNIRGEEATFNVVPRGVTYKFDENGSFIETEINGEGETSELNSTNGDIPNVDEDFGDPPISFPPDPPIFVGEDPSVPPKKIIIHEKTRGLLYTEDGDNPDGAHWEMINGGLNTDDLKTQMTDILVTNYRRVYLGYRNAMGSLIYAADQPGGIFREIMNEEILRDLVGADPELPCIIQAMGINTLADDQIALFGGEIDGPPSYVRSGGVILGNADGFTVGNSLEDPNLVGTARSISFGSGKWTVTGWLKSPFAQNAIWNFTPSGALVGVMESFGDSLQPIGFHVRAGSSGILYAMDPDRFYRYSGGTFEETGGGKYALAGHFYDTWWFDVEPTSMHMMIATSGSAGFKSSDSGYSWSSLGAVLPIGILAFGWAKYDPLRWVAAGGNVYFSPDFGTTWQDISGNLAYVCPLPVIDYIKVIE